MRNKDTFRRKILKDFSFLWKQPGNIPTEIESINQKRISQVVQEPGALTEERHPGNLQEDTAEGASVQAGPGWSRKTGPPEGACQKDV